MSYRPAAGWVADRGASSLTETRPPSATPMAIDFLIVGGGIGGAVLAHLLRRRGLRVLVLEKGHGPAPQNRPEVLWPATVDVLRTLIPANLDDRWMVPIRGGTVVYEGRPLLQFGPEVFDAA